MSTKKTMDEVRRDVINKSNSRLENLRSGDIDLEKREVCLTYSSETPVERWFGHEVICHKEGAQDLSRLNANGPLLLNHDENKQIGVVLEAKIENGKGKALVKFSRSKEGEDAFRDVQDGILTSVSYRYQYKDMELIERGEDREDGIDVYRINQSKAVEISLVSIPADIDVGVGRSFSSENAIPVKNEPKNSSTTERSKENSEDINANINQSIEDKGVQQMNNDLRSQMLEIMEIGDKFGMQDLAKKFIQDGRSADELRQAVLSKMSSNSAPAANDTQEEIGLTDKEAKNFNFLGALRAATTGDWRGMEFEREVSNATAQKFNKETSGFLVPTDVLRRMTVADSDKVTTGGSFVGTDLKSDSFIEMLSDRLVVKQLGAQVLDNLKGNLAIPRQTGGAAAQFVNEGEAAPESFQTTDQVTMSPRTVGSWVDISRKLLLQSSVSVEQFVIRDICNAIARKIDHAALFGTGEKGEPMGIVTLAGIEGSGVNVINAGAQGGALTYKKLVEMETAVAAANTNLDSLKYLTSPKVRGYMKTTLKADGIAGYLWEGQMRNGDGIVNGYSAAVSNIVRNDLSKGAKNDLSAIILGAWNDLILGSWGVLDVQTNPYGPGANAGTVRIRALQDVDVAIRHPESFSVMKDIAIK